MTAARVPQGMNTFTKVVIYCTVFVVGILLGRSKSTTLPSISDKNVEVVVEKTSVSTAIQPTTELQTSSMLPSLSNRIIYMMHITKCAGSTLCQAAKLNGFEANYKGNCNPPGTYRCCGKDRSLASQRAFASNTTYRMVANEFYLIDFLDREHYFYTILLRKSANRYVSNWKHLYREIFLMETSRVVSEEMKPILKNFTTWWQTQRDNFSTRWICGFQCVPTAKYHISKAQFMWVLHRLRQFEGLVIVERYPETYGYFARQVGWSTDKTPVPYTHGSEKYEYPIPRNYTNIIPDRQMTVLDDIVYDYGELLFERRRDGLADVLPEDFILNDEIEDAMQSYFSITDPESTDIRKSCSNPCCSPSCWPE